MKKNEKTKGFLVAVVVLLFLMTIMIAMSASVAVFAQETKANLSVETEADLSVMDNGKYDNYTNTATKNGISIDEYANNFAHNASWNGYDIVYNGDNNIVNFIPRELFCEQGKTLYIGKEYGFMVDCFPVTNAVHTTSMHSTVMLFKIMVNNNMAETKDHLIITVKHIFQGEFALKPKGQSSIEVLYIGDANFFVNGYVGSNGIICYGDQQDFIVPVPSCRTALTNFATFNQYTKYYITDIANEVSLYNVTHANPINGDYYCLDKDYGAYFTQFDFSYDASVYQRGSNCLEKEKEVGATIASLSFDLLNSISDIADLIKISSAMNIISYVNDAIDIVNLIDNIGLLNENQKDKLTSVNKHLTYIPFRTVRQEQVNQGYLNKDLLFILEEIAGSKLYLSLGDEVTFDYQTSTENTSIRNIFANALNISVLSMTLNSENDKIPIISESISSAGCYSDYVLYRTNDSVEPEINDLILGEQNLMYILPSKENVQKFRPTETIPFVFECDNSNARIRIYKNSYWGDLVAESSIINNRAVIDEVTLNADEEYYIVFDLLGKKQDIEAISNPTIRENEYRKMKGQYGVFVLNCRPKSNQINFGENEIQVLDEKVIMSFTPTKNLYYELSMQETIKYATLSDLTMEFTYLDVSQNKLLINLEAGKEYIIVLKIKTNSNDKVKINVKGEKHIYYYNTGDNELPMDVIQVGDTLDLPQPKSLGNDFLGWKLSPEQVGYITSEDLNNVDQSDITLYGTWEKSKYLLTLDPCNGENSTIYIVEYGASFPSAKKPIRKGYTFCGYYTERDKGGIRIYDSDMYSENVWNYESNKTLYACWEQNTYIITLLYEGKYYDQIDICYGEIVKYSNTLINHRLIGIYSSPNRQGIRYIHTEIIYSSLSDSYSVQIISDKQPWTIEGNGVLYIEWERLKVNYPITVLGSGEGIIDTIYKEIVGGETTKLSAPAKDGYTFTRWDINGHFYETETVDYNFTLTISRYTGEVVIDLMKFPPPERIDYGYIKLSYEKKSCIATGTMITLDDGSQMPVEHLTGNEMLLVWNLKTGTFDSAPILFIDKDVTQKYEVINLYFSDGTNVKVISEHAFWDFNLNKYVYLKDDATQYIGHWFNKQIIDDGSNLTWTKVQLTKVVIQEEYTTAYSPVTYEHLCYYVNGMLSMPGGIDGLFNIFEVDAETLKYDEVAVNEDIETYGLFTYEEFTELYFVPETMFEACGGKYLKIALGKGIITEERLCNLINRYGLFFE